MIIDKIEEGKRRAREEEERKKNGHFRDCEGEKATERGTAGATEEVPRGMCPGGKLSTTRFTPTPQKMAAAVEEEADAKRLGKLGRRGGPEHRPDACRARARGTHLGSSKGPWS
jgi:hypothetical protein